VPRTMFKRFGWQEEGAVGAVFLATHKLST
jgi:hypothetical protein